MCEKSIIPLLTGDYPDPTVAFFKGKYYMTHSTGMETPNLLLWQSDDLLRWQPTVHACRSLWGLAAPELAVKDDRLLLYVPCGGSNFVLWSTDGVHWSEPVDLRIGEIDPGYVRDRATGKQYLHMSAGHVGELGDDALSCGALRRNYEGWLFPRDWDVEGYPCLESPKLVYRAPYYYMTCAEGGTGGPSTSHMVVSARSLTPVGPWENSPHNPIVHCQSDAERWWTKGHGTLIEGRRGQWWLIYHAYERGNHNLGRQTVMQPVLWLDDGWYVTDDDRDCTALCPTHPPLSDDFAGAALGWQWSFFGDPVNAQYSISDGLRLAARGDCVTQGSLCSLAPMDKEYDCRVRVSLEPGAVAGLLCYYSDNLYTGVGASREGLYFWQSMYKRQLVLPFAAPVDCLWLRLQKTRQNVRFYFSLDGERWERCETTVVVEGFNHNVEGSYRAIRLALAAFGENGATF